jgi:hypothetical protein
MNRLSAVLLFLVSSGAAAYCSSSLPLSGTLFIESCNARDSDCKPAARVLYEYMQAEDDNPSLLTIGVQTSPWHFYDPDMRIVGVDEFAAKIRPSLKGPVKRVELQGSWTGVAPDKDHKSLADQLSTALNRFPVSGMAGFMWVAKGGKLRTTRQAFSIRKGNGPYGVHSGDEVMAALTAGWPAEMEDYFVKQHDADGVMRAAAGWDIFFLCPDRALVSFERAAKMGNPVAAYDAAMMRIERGDKADRQAAVVLLSRAVELGDKKAQSVLQKLKRP